MTDPHHVLFPDDPDPLARWRRDTEKRDQQIADERRREERQRLRDQERIAAAGAVNDAAQLRDEIQQLREADITIAREVCDFLIDQMNNLVDDCDKFVRRMVNEVSDKVDRRLGALEAEVKATLREGRREFRFARDRDADMVEELPNPLRMRDLN
jgi:hypothetical protein